MNRKRSVICLFLLAFFTASTQAGSNLEQLMSSWLDLEGQTGHLTSSWQERKQQIHHQVRLLETEKKSLNELLSQTSQNTDKVNQRRKELVAQQDKLEQEQDQRAAQLAAAADTLTVLLERMPPPIQDQWRDQLDILHRDGPTLNEKIERALKLARTAEQFQNRIAIHKTIMALPTSRGEKASVQVTQIYLGLSQGLYVSTDGAYYGRGQSSPAGWAWQHSQELNRDGQHDPLLAQTNPAHLLQIIEMIENPTRAKLITLPLQL